MRDAVVPAIDLKQLVTLEAIVRARSVTEAARELGISQPTLSHRLARLRETFGDPLIVRSGNRSTLTPSAERLREPLAGVLRNLRSLLVGPTFDPATAVEHYRLACTDYLARLVVPGFVHALRTRAPGVDVTISSWGTKCFEDLASGALDFGMGLVRRDMPGIHRRTLFEDEFVCVAARKNRRAKAGMTPERFAALPHVRVSVTGVGEGAVDTALRALGLERRVAIQVQQFWLAPELVADTDLVVTLPRRVARELEGDRRLRVFPVPVPVEPFGIHLLWHERQQNDPMHRLVRELIAGSLGTRA